MTTIEEFIGRTTALVLERRPKARVEWRMVGRDLECRVRLTDKGLQYFVQNRENIYILQNATNDPADYLASRIDRELTRLEDEGAQMGESE
jgi:hypothetical protein